MECKITPKVGVVIVAGGKGLRVGGATPKQFRILSQAPVLAHSINALSTALKPSEIVVVLPESHIEFWNNLASRFEIASHRVVAGGAERFHSVKNGIEALAESVDVIAVHDGVRPLCSVPFLQECLHTALESGSAVPVVEISDSIRMISDEGSVMLDRSKLRAVQTPQIFDAIVLRRAYIAEFNPSLTDDASVVEASGTRVTLCPGQRRNIKITTQEDLIFAQMLLDENDEDDDI